MRHAVGTVFVILPTLVLHHVPLDVELAVRQDFEQVAHPVGFEPEEQFEVVGGNVNPVVGAVGRGGAVQVGPDFHERLEETGIVVLGTFEHDVLEQVGEAGLALVLVLGADVIPEVDRCHRERVVPGEYYVEAVGEGEFVEFDRDHGAFQSRGVRERVGGAHRRPFRVGGPVRPRRI